MWDGIRGDSGLHFGSQFCKREGNTSGEDPEPSVWGRLGRYFDTLLRFLRSSDLVG